MIHILVQISKYFMILLFLIYTYECFHVFRFESNSGRQQAIYNTQRELMYERFLNLYKEARDRHDLANARQILDSLSKLLGLNEADKIKVETENITVKLV